MHDQKPGIVLQDPWLEPFAGVIANRMKKSVDKLSELTSGTRILKDFATGHLYFGIHRKEDRWVIREWAPNATAIYLIGDFSGWQESKEFSFIKLPGGNWELDVSYDVLKHEDLYKLSIHWPGGKGERIPAWASRVVQDPGSLIFNAQVWNPKEPYQWKIEYFRRDDIPPLIYEAHVGMATEDWGVGSYIEFREKVLPRIKKAGYNTIQLMAIQEHPYYGSFGYHVSSFFAPSSRFGTPDELKSLVDRAHEMGIAVIMDIVHSHAVRNEVEGLGKYDGTRYQFFHSGSRGEHVAWDSLCFNYGKNEVLHFLLSNISYWLEEFHFDGFRFDGVTSMLYLDHGLSRDFTNYGLYFDGNQDEDAITYFILANKLLKEINEKAFTVAEEMSGMPGLAAPSEIGGMGFNYRLAMGIPDYWIKIIKELSDEQWNVNQMFHELSSHRVDEKTIGYCESHDQALVGDKTIIFRLMDKEMYYCMNKESQNLIIDRGMALHKMIRLITIGTAGGGYLTFMGNEFGHPEWIDFPREGNNWSYKYARRQWSLSDNPSLRYHLLSDFDRDMITLIEKEQCLMQPFPNKLFDNEGDQVVAFERAGLLFIFNFHPVQSYTDYGITVWPGKYIVALCTDNSKYGGFDRVDESFVYYTNIAGKLAKSSENHLRIYLPSRTAMVMKRLETKSVYD